MSKELKKAKEIIKKEYKNYNGGLFDSPNGIGDPTSTIYEDKKILIRVCDIYEYIEVIGLKPKEFDELNKLYLKLSGKKYKNTKTKPTLKSFGPKIKYKDGKFYCSNKDYQKFIRFLYDTFIVEDCSLSSYCYESGMNITLKVPYGVIEDFKLNKNIKEQ